LNSRILVLFQTPAVPLLTVISPAKTKPQRRDSYQPRERGDHSKEWTRMGLGSMLRTSVARMVARADWVSVGALPVEGSLGVSSEMSVRMVWRGRVGSQDSI
jgi:hypothetical protein